MLDERGRVAGRIKVFGGSNWTPARIDEANAYAERTGKQGFSVLSNHFGLAEAYDVPWAGCEHVTDAASKQWLTEAADPAASPGPRRRAASSPAGRDPMTAATPELVRCYYSDDNFERLRRAESSATPWAWQPTAIALAFVLRQPFPTFPLFGPRASPRPRRRCRGSGSS